MKSILPAAALFLYSFSGSLRAAVVQYTLDPAASLVTAAVNFAGVQLGPQTPGSDTAGFAGTFIGDLDGGMLDLQASAPLSALQPALQLPGNLPGDPFSSFGFAGQHPSVGQVFVSISTITFYISSEFLPPLDIQDGAFGPTDFGFFLSDGTCYFSTPTIERGVADLHGRGAPNQTSLQGSLTTSGAVETLILPIQTSFAITSLSSEDTVLTFSGQFVAHRVIPEPSGLLLAILGGGGVLMRRRRLAR